jgi:hypothetical protein
MHEARSRRRLPVARKNRRKHRNELHWPATVRRASFDDIPSMNASRSAPACRPCFGLAAEETVESQMRSADRAPVWWLQLHGAVAETRHRCGPARASAAALTLRATAARTHRADVARTTTHASH